jgi:hypothetical protein
LDDNNNNVPIESGDATRRNLIIVMSGVVILGVCALSVLGYMWFRPGQDSAFSTIFPTATPTRRPASLPTSTIETVPAFATPIQEPLAKAEEPPSFAAAEEAGAMLQTGGDYLESYAVSFPDIPDINQPGDIYTYNIELNDSIPLIWEYGWCTTTTEILEENFQHIQVIFTADATAVPDGNIAIIDSQREDGSPCRDYVVLVNKWTPGQHQLQTQVIFTEDIDDGWNLYPAGIHTYEYIVSVYQ